MDVMHIAQLLTLAHKATLHLARTPPVVMAMTTARRGVNSKGNGPWPAEHRDRTISGQSAQVPRLTAQLEEQLTGRLRQRVLR